MEVRGNDRGRDIGYFLDLMDRFQKYLGRRSRSGIRSLTDVEKRQVFLILKEDPLFNDPYGSKWSFQLYIFYSLLCSYRKQFTPEMLTEMILA